MDAMALFGKKLKSEHKVLRKLEQDGAQLQPETHRPTLQYRCPGARAIPELHKSLFGKTYNIAAGDQKVINDTYINEVEGTLQSLGDEFVCSTEAIILAGMIVN